MGTLPGFGDEDCVAHEEVDILGSIHMVPKEPPKQYPPGDAGGAKALDGARAATFAGPACAPSHRHPPRHGHQRPADTAPLADRGGCDVRTGTLQQCYNIDHRCAPLWCMSCRLGQRNSPRQRATFPHFWRRYCHKRNYCGLIYLDCQVMLTLSYKSLLY